AGAIGVAVAYELARKGAEVVVAEAREAVGAECSYGNAGLVTSSHCVPLAKPGLLWQIPGWLRPGGSVHVRPRASLDLVRFGRRSGRSSGRGRMIEALRTLRDLSRASRDLFEELVRDGVDFGYRHDGVMNVCATEAVYSELCSEAELLRQEGFEPQIL